MNTKYITIGVLAVVVIVVGVLFVKVFSTPTQPPIPTPTEKEIRAMPGSELSTDYFSVNGVKHFFTNVAMANATTTLCLMKNPAGNATSTLVSFTYQITTGTTTAAYMDIATSTLISATSSAATIFKARSVASGNLDSFIFTFSDANAGIIAPNEYLILKTEGLGVGGYTYKGKCKAEWKAF